MKNILIGIICSFILCFSCSKLSTPTTKYGVINSIKKTLTYDPILHMYMPLYKYQITIDDTIVSYSTRTKYDIGDSIKYILY